MTTISRDLATTRTVTEHDARVARIAAAIRERAAARRGSGEHVSLGKAAVSHFVPNPHDPRHSDRKLDVRDLREVLEVDVEGRTCTAEPGLTFEELVRATLPLGLAPMLVPELKTITIGGAVSGCSVESMSYKYGGFHDSCLEYEVVTGRGEVLRAAPDENAELFDMVHGSYGTLGIITKLKFRLIPAKPFVHVEYGLFDNFEEFHRAMLERIAKRDHDFIDAVIHGRDKLVLCLGRFADRAPVEPSSYTFLNVFFESTLRRREDWLTTYDYFFRYDTDCHWLTKTLPGMTTKPMRLLLGKALLGSTNLLRWADRLRPVLKLRKNPPVVVDCFIPDNRFEAFFRWYERAVDHWPLWVVPYRIPKAYGWIAPAHAEKMQDDLCIDCAIYGKANDDPGVDYYKLLEDKTYELNGVKTLISKNSYDRETFWTIYNKPLYEKVKARTDPENLFRGLYEKFHFGEGRRPGTGTAAPEGRTGRRDLRRAPAPKAAGSGSPGGGAAASA
jgi:FAD/FMN-containing dehydrogenase